MGKKRPAHSPSRKRSGAKPSAAKSAAARPGKRPTHKPAADRVGALIAGYRASRDRNGELDIILPHYQKPRVFELLLEVVGDAKEDVNARTKVLAHFERLRPPVRTARGRRLLEALLELVARKVKPRSDDGEVQEWAIRALKFYAGSKEVTDVLVAVLRDPKRGWGTRAAAFDALAYSSTWRKRKPIFEALRSDPVMGEEADTILRVREDLD